MAESKARPPAPPRPNQVRAAAKAGASVAPTAPRKPEARPSLPVDAATQGAPTALGSSPRLISPRAPEAAPPGATKPLPPGKPTSLPSKGATPPPLRKAAPSVPQAASAAPTEPKKPLTSTAPLAPSAPKKPLTSTAPLAPPSTPVDAAKTVSTEAPVRKPLTSTAPLAPTTPGRPMRPSAPPPLPARAAPKPSTPALPVVTATQSTPAGLGDQTVAEGSPAYASPFDDDMEDAPTMATAAPEFEAALDEALAARREAPVDLGRTLAVEALRAQARFAPAPPPQPAPRSHPADLADQTHTMVMPSAPPPPPASTAPKFDEALFQAPSVTPRTLAAKAALPPFRPRIETADHFEPSGDQYVPDADLLWKPGEPAGDMMPAQPLLHSRSAPTVQTHAVPAPEMRAPEPRASSFGDNEFWAPPPDYRGAVPTTGANVVAPDLMDASMRGQMSQSIGVTKSRIPASYAIVGAAVLATMLCVLAIAFSR
jgi:hypothetical protein